MILLVEDNDEDHVAFERALAHTNASHPLHRCPSGDDALAFLERCHAANGGPTRLPAVIVLDLNMPGSDGREVLRRLKRDTRFRSIPVIILTTSSNPRDVNACYDDGANSYIVKSIDFTKFESDMRLLIEYWFEASLLPATVDARNEL